MRRTTIFADDELLDQIREISEEQNDSVAETIRKAMRSYVQQKRQKKKQLSFVGIARSGRKDIAERHEELLWEKNSE